MSVGGELLWRVLPPLSFTTENLSLAALLEPCYEVGGDAFDYAVDHGIARVAMFDAVGHDLSASVTAALTLAATRAARTRGDSLPEIARAADRTLMEHFQQVQFTTAVLADIDISDGTVRYVNAGHPPPVLVRQHKAVASLDGGRRTPLGVSDDVDDVAELALQPGDRLLFYTDGVIEARDEQGGRFGLDRLVDFVERHDSDGLPAPETLRRLRHSVLAHQRGKLQDDASLMIIEWGPRVGAGWAA
jgi:serine phosphatase RsbU (regulator of sigma subunit)